jgi:hypothetical protein
MSADSAAGGIKRWGLVVWPAFLAASLLEALVFALVDPGELHWPGQWGQPSRQAVYAMAFFAFWIITMACSAMVLWLANADLDDMDGLTGRPAD